MADERDPRWVFSTPDLAGANVLAEWLGKNGYLCEVVPPAAVPPAGDALGFTEPPPPVAEVRVIDIDQAGPARAALAEQRELLAEVKASHERRAARTGTVTAVCEECGKASDWPAADMGTTQDCPYCGRFMDVPDPDAEGDWGDVDFGTEDDEDEGGEPPTEEKR